jgi:hypothetical protein
MQKMIRKQVYLRRDQDRFLKKLAKKQGRTEADLIREAMGRLIKSIEREAAWAAEWKMIEQRMKLAPVRRGRNWKREDLYDR